MANAAFSSLGLCQLVYNSDRGLNNRNDEKLGNPVTTDHVIVSRQIEIDEYNLNLTSEAWVDDAWRVQHRHAMGCSQSTSGRYEADGAGGKLDCDSSAYGCSATPGRQYGRLPCAEIASSVRLEGWSGKVDALVE